MSALVTGGPGTPASAADLARYVRDFDPDEVIGLRVADGGDAGREDDEDAEFDGPDFDDGDFEDYEDEFDELSIEGLFLHVTGDVVGAWRDRRGRPANAPWLVGAPRGHAPRLGGIAPGAPRLA